MRLRLSVPDLGEREARYVRAALEAGEISASGEWVGRLERLVAAVAGRAHVLATVSGTAALHLALRAAGIGRGDEVVLPTLTFIASANAVRYAGAEPVFVDVEPRFWQMDAEMLERFCSERCEGHREGLINLRTGCRVAAVMPVHALGHPVDLDSIAAIAARHRLLVIEDAAQAMGARYRGAPVGRTGHVACFSFNGNKVATAGNGGALATDDSTLASRARYLAYQAKDRADAYVHGDVGYNYALSNINAAIGVAQLERLDELVDRRRAVAACYRDALRDQPDLRLQPEAEWARSSYWLSTVQVDGASASSIEPIVARLAERDIEARRLWQPLHRSQPYATGESVGGANADRIYDTAISLPSSAGLSTSDQARIVEELLRARAASRASVSSGD